MAEIDKRYNNLLNTILNEGFKYEDPNRKGVHRIQIPGYKFVYDFKDGFPAITTKKLYWKGVVGELLWLLRGDTNIKYLVDNGINIWNKDALNYCNSISSHPYDMNTFLQKVKYQESLDCGYIFGDLDRVYGYQLRNFGGEFDQLKWIIDTMKNNPLATKKTVTFINPNDKKHQALTPCHTGFKILVEPLSDIDINMQKQAIIIDLHRGKHPNPSEQVLEKEYLKIPKYQFTLQWEQDSVDTFLGLPFNISSYALLAQIIGRMTNMIPKGIIGDLSNVHIYEPHLDAVKEQLSRDVDKYSKCELHFAGEESNQGLEKGLINNIDNLNIRNFKLRNYKSYPRIPAEMLPYS
jgi:thymidylate synthase